MVERRFSTGNISDDEAKRILALSSRFGITSNHLGAAGVKLVKSEILRYLDRGEVPQVKIVDNIPIILQPGEKVIWGFTDVTYLTVKKHTEYVGSSSGMSIRLMKGLYYRTGTFHGQPVRTEYLSKEGRGILVITNKTLYFWSPNKAVKAPFRKIISTQPFADAIQILRDGSNAAPQFFKLDDPLFAADLIARASAL